MPGIEKKISQAKSKLLIDYPYFGTLASKLELVVNDDIQAFKSDGISLHYNSDFFEGLELSEMEFVFANGAMHASLAHEARKNGRSGWLWQMATDLAINDMLVQNGMDLPHGAQYRVRFEGMYAEEIYAELKDDILREDENLEYEADDAGDVQNNENKNEEKNTQTQTQEQLLEEVLKEQLFAEDALSQLTKEIQKGEAPQSIDRFFKLEKFGKIDWREEIKIALERFFKDDYVLIPPNKKFLHMGIYLPSNISRTFRLVIAVDSSGSVDEDLLNQFLNEVNFLMSLVHHYQIEMLVCDDKIHSHRTFYSGDTLECDLRGGGGTDFRPVFDFIDKELDDTKLLLYFTDLQGIFPHAQPNYALKWVAPRRGEVPFGEVILLD
ncbi:hypothetical protein KJ877_06070 [bacterium]|nr:hypothetical protein [bacterium]MBU1989751.1 hypothetical protein [bacterium]